MIIFSLNHVRFLRAAKIEKKDTAGTIFNLQERGLNLWKAKLSG